jgi:hypothetical protein
VIRNSSDNNFVIAKVSASQNNINCYIYIDAILNVEISLSKLLSSTKNCVFADVSLDKLRIDIRDTYIVLLDLSSKRLKETSCPKFSSRIHSPKASTDHASNRYDIHESSLALFNQERKESLRDSDVRHAVGVHHHLARFELSPLELLSHGDASIIDHDVYFP